MLIIFLTLYFSHSTTGRIEFHAFVSVMAARVAAQEQQEEALKMFRLFDIDATGRLTYTDVRRVAHDLSGEFDEAELQVRRRTAHFRSNFTFLVFVSLLRREVLLC